MLTKQLLIFKLIAIVFYCSNLFAYNYLKNVTTVNFNNP